jgi:hypothetical protein
MAFPQEARLRKVAMTLQRVIRALQARSGHYELETPGNSSWACRRARPDRARSLLRRTCPRVAVAPRRDFAPSGRVVLKRARSRYVNGLELTAASATASRSPGADRRPDRPRQLPLTDAHRRIEREARPPMRCAGHRGRPPQLLGKWPLADGATSSASHTGDETPDRGHASFRALLRDSRQKGADLGLPVPAVTAERPD